jgi:hypothetical protein
VPLRCPGLPTPPPFLESRIQQRGRVAGILKLGADGAFQVTCPDSGLWHLASLWPSPPLPLPLPNKQRSPTTCRLAHASYFIHASCFMLHASGLREILPRLAPAVVARRMIPGRRRWMDEPITSTPISCPRAHATCKMQEAARPFVKRGLQGFIPSPGRNA